MNAETIGALAGLIAALTGLISVVQNSISFYQVRREALKNRIVSEGNQAAIAAVDVKVDNVVEQTNGHMTTLIAAVAPVDPALATATAIKIEQSATLTADKLRKVADGSKPDGMP